MTRTDVVHGAAEGRVGDDIDERVRGEFSSEEVIAVNAVVDGLVRELQGDPSVVSGR